MEVSATSDKDGLGKCVGTRGTGIFEGAKFSGTFAVSLYWYYYAAMDATAGFKIQEGTGEIMLK